MNRKFLALFLLVYLPIQICAQEAIVLTSDNDQIQIHQLAAIRPKSNKATIYNVAKLQDWRVVTEKTIDNIYSESKTEVVWLRFEVQNQSNHKKWVLNSEWYLTLDLQAWQLTHSGNILRKDKTTLQNTKYHKLEPVSIAYNPAMQIQINPNETKIIYLRLSYAAHKMGFPFLQKDDYFQQQRLIEAVTHGLFFGIMLISLFYNFFIFASLREKTYALYVCSLLFFIVYQLSITGFLTHIDLGSPAVTWNLAIYGNC